MIQNILLNSVGPEVSQTNKYRCGLWHWVSKKLLECTIKGLIPFQNILKNFIYSTLFN